jgi:two-component system, NarL family, invasion response regulator UvrY
MTIKVVLIDESPIFRTGLKKCLTDSGSPIEVIGEAADGASGQRLLRQKPPDMVLLSADLPDGAALTLCDFAAAHFPKMPILCLLSAYYLNLLDRLRHTAIKGFLTKDSIYSFREAIETVHSGKTYLQPDIGLEWLHWHGKQGMSSSQILTDREYQVLLLLARGKTTEEIAGMTHLSIRTIFNLKSSGFKKWEIDTVDQLRQMIIK